MSQSATVTRTSITSRVQSLDTEVLRSASGLLKLFEIVLGILCLAITAYYHPRSYSRGYSESTYFFIVAFAFLITTSLILLSSIISYVEASIISKTLFELLYHASAFIFYFTASLAFLFHSSYYNQIYYGYESRMAASIIGVANSILYLLSTFFSFRSYKNR